MIDWLIDWFFLNQFSKTNWRRKGNENKNKKRIILWRYYFVSFFLRSKKRTKCKKKRKHDVFFLKLLNTFPSLSHSLSLFVFIFRVVIDSFRSFSLAWEKGKKRKENKKKKKKVRKVGDTFAELHKYHVFSFFLHIFQWFLILPFCAAQNRELVFSNGIFY